MDNNQTPNQQPQKETILDKANNGLWNFKVKGYTICALLIGAVIMFSVNGFAGFLWVVAGGLTFPQAFLKNQNKAGLLWIISLALVIIGTGILYLGGNIE